MIQKQPPLPEFNKYPTSRKTHCQVTPHHYNRPRRTPRCSATGTHPLLARETQTWAVSKSKTRQARLLSQGKFSPPPQRYIRSTVGAAILTRKRTLPVRPLRR